MTGARFDSQVYNGDEFPHSDAFGRLFRSVKKWETLEGTVIKEGYEPAHVSEQCLGDVELKLILHKQ